MSGVRIPLSCAALVALLGLVACAGDDSPTGPATDQPATPVLDASSPPSNWWLTRAAMPTARAGLVAATVNNRIYAIGGRNSSGLSLAKVEMYNPAATLIAWTSRAPLPSGRSWPSGAATIDGRIYVTGGYDGNSARTRTLYVYDPAANQWSAKAPIPVATAHGASAVISGRLYVLTPPASASDPQRTKLHRYNPSTNAWAGRAAAPVNLEGAVVGVINGKLYAAGGLDGSGTRRRLYLYDPSADTWTRKADVPMPRRDAAGLALGGKLYLVGGVEGTPAGTNQVYSPGSNAWTAKPSMITPRYVAAAAAAGGWLYVLGGIPNGGNSAVGTNEAFVP